MDDGRPFAAIRNAAAFLQPLRRGTRQSRAAFAAERRQDLRGDCRRRNPMQAEARHFPAKAKNVIYLFMAGAPSQFELFDFKPALQKYNNQPVPDSLMAGKRFAFMDTFAKDKPKLLGTQRKFKQYGQQRRLGIGSAAAHRRRRGRHHFSEGRLHRELQSWAGEVLRRTPAPRALGGPAWAPGSPTGSAANRTTCRDSWCCNRDRAARAEARHCGPSGFLPTAYQGVPFRSGGDPILDLSRPEGHFRRTRSRKPSRRFAI